MGLFKKKNVGNNGFKLKANNDIIHDAINIYNGVYAPLTGFLREKDFKSVVENMRLASGEIWSIPIVLDISEEEKNKISGAEEIILTNENGKARAVLADIEIYPYDKKEFAEKVFGTTDEDHPGVKEVMGMGEFLVGGDVVKIFGEERIFSDYHFTPEETKNIFKDKGWKTIVAFQTRNVPHRSHEFLQKKALAEVDAIMIHPVIGKKKPGDFTDEAILESYKILLEKYYPKEKSFLNILPIKMRYAGPREAVMHALIRRNYGCTHMIIGRDHAGVGNYYGSYDAHNLFDQFKKDELGIEILKFENVSHCHACNELKMDGDCEHGNEHKFSISGTKMREMIKNGEVLPEELIRREISEFLINHPNPFVD